MASKLKKVVNGAFPLRRETTHGHGPPGGVPRLHLSLDQDYAGPPRHNSWCAPVSPTQPTDIPRSSSASSPRPRTHSISAQGNACALEDLMLSSASMSPPQSTRRARSSSIRGSEHHSARMLSSLMQVREALPKPKTDAPTELLVAENPHPLFEYFCVCGVRSAARGERPQVLAAIPADRIGRAAPVPGFCFADRDPGATPINDASTAQYTDVDQLTRGTNTFMFCMQTFDESNYQNITLYGFVVRHLEVLQDPSELVPRSSVIRGGGLLAQRHMTWRAYCIVSRNPYGLLFWKLLWEWTRLEHERLVAKDAESMQRRQARLAKFETILDRLYSQVTLCGEPFIVKSSLCFRDTEITFNVPPVEEGVRPSVACLCLPALLRAFSSENLVLLLAAVLTECKVVLISTQAGRVSACAMALVSAIAPLVWQSSFVPLLARDMVTAIASPVPIICGYVSDSMDLPEDCGAETEHETIVVASVDRNRIEVLGRPVVHLPYAYDLGMDLEPRCGWLRKGRRVSNNMCEDEHPFEALTGTVAVQVFEAMEDMLHYTTWLVNSMRRVLPPNAHQCDITDPRITEQLAAGREHPAFVRAFAQSSIFVRLVQALTAAEPPDSREEGIYCDKVL